MMLTALTYAMAVIHMSTVESSKSFHPSTFVPPHHRFQQKQQCLSTIQVNIPSYTSPTKLQSQNSSSNNNKPIKNNNNNNNNDKVPPIITNTVLKQVYTSLLAHKAQYGNPNIPLGTSDGKKCKTLRRLYVEDKLSREEIELLNVLEFRWSTLEDVYEEADFDVCLGRLVEYEKLHKNNYQIPKKYPSDPELGAWVTMIRRIGRDNIPSNQRTKLDEINFAWKSTRKCGSSFMTHYRVIKEKLNVDLEGEGEGVRMDLLKEEDKKWITAQRIVYEKGNLSEARVKYMDQLVGLNWREPLED